jgi:hypothetical protein
MKLQISLPPDTWEQVKELAQGDRRSPRQQIEYLVIRAVKNCADEGVKREPVAPGVSDA